MASEEEKLAESITNGNTGGVETNNNDQENETTQTQSDTQSNNNQQQNASGNGQDDSKEGDLVKVTVHVKKDGTIETNEIEVYVTATMKGKQIIGVVVENLKESNSSYIEHEEHVLYYQIHKNSKIIILKDDEVYPGKNIHLNYIEADPAQKRWRPDLRTCTYCGNEEPMFIEYDNRKYVNPHLFKQKRVINVDGSNVKINLRCRECALLAKLDINADEEDSSQTSNQLYLILTGIFLSPAFWVSISFPLAEPILMLISIIAICVCVVIGGCLFLYGHIKTKQVKESFYYFQDPYHLVPQYYPHCFFVCMIVLNVLNLIELIRLYHRKGLNAAHECTLGLEDDEWYPQECVVYLELISSATIVLLATLFINVAVCRKPKTFCDQQMDKKKKYGESYSHSLDALKEKAQKFRKSKEEDEDYEAIDKYIGMYYDAAIDVIEEVRESEAPATIKNGYWPICKGNFWLPGWKMTILTILYVVFCGGMILVSLYTHPEEYTNKLNNSPGHIPSVVISYILVAWVLLTLCVTMFRVTMIFRKAYALMRIPTNPMDFIENTAFDEQHKVNIEPQYKNMLLTRARIVQPKFLLSWWNLRKHIEEWELAYFYALTNPIISLEVVYVLGVLIFALIAIFQDEYGGDIRLFLVDVVNRSNLVIIFLLFTVMVIITLLVHLYNLLAPFSEQSSHDSWVTGRILELKFETANCYRYVNEEWKAFENRQAKYESTIALLETLKTEMETKIAPSLLGVFELSQERIQAIMAAVIAPITLFGTTFVEGIFTELGENSGFIPTASPTAAPTVS